MPHGLVPTSNEPIGALFTGSMKKTWLKDPVVTYTVNPSGATAMPIGRGLGVLPCPSSVMSRRNFCCFASKTATAPSFSSDTYPREPSGRNPIDRGLGPTGMRLSSLLVWVSIANTAPVAFAR